MPSEQDLFAEEQQMVTMSFGEHIEELRVRLILAPARPVRRRRSWRSFPPLDLGRRVMKKMEAPAKAALERFYRNEYEKKATAAEEQKRALARRSQAMVPAEASSRALQKVAPKLELPPAEQLKDRSVEFPLRYDQSHGHRA